MGTNTNILPDREFFVGREAESAALEQALRGGERLISIIGPSGAGKTRIARQVALRLVPEREGAGGVWFCDLSTAHKKEDLLSVVALVLGTPGTGEQRRGGVELARALANRGSLLLILDNFEYLEPDALEVLSRWLSYAPKLQLVVTSLASLGLEGESLFELGPLKDEAAIALYEDRAKRAWAGERIFFSGERRALGELVRRLDCLPLAIELAAARVRVLPPLAMLSRIEDRFELLQSRSAGRQSSLEHAIHCSWELLEPAERLALSRASVFSGGFTLEAAEEVLAASANELQLCQEEGSERQKGPQPEAGAEPSAPTSAELGASKARVLELLEGLRDKALVQLDDSNPPRFSLYESMQAFAARKLERAGGTEEARQRHASYFLSRGEAWAKQTRGPNGPIAIERLVAERENLLAVHRRHLETSPAIAVRAALAVSRAMALGGSISSEFALLGTTVEAARRAADPRLLAEALRLRSSVHRRQGRLEEARRDREEALEFALQAGVRVLEGHLRSELGILLEHLGEYDEAEAQLERGYAIAKESNDPGILGAVRMSMGVLADTRGLHREAQHHFQEASEIFKASGDWGNHGRAVHNLSLMHMHLEDFEGARLALLEAGRSFRRARSPVHEGETRLGLGIVERVSGRLVEAEKHLSAALAGERLFGNRRFEALALANLGVLALEQNQLQLASQRLVEALTLVRESGDEPTVYRLLPFLGAVRAILGEVDAAKMDFDEAKRWFDSQQDLSHLAVIHTLEGFVDLALAGIARRGGRAEEAASLMAEVVTRIGASRPAVASMFELSSARRLLERALERYTDRSAFSHAGEHDEQERGERAPLPIGAEAEAPFNGSASGSPHYEASGPGMTLTVSSDFSWLELTGKPRLRLGPASVRRRMLQALIEQHLLAPGIAVGLEQLAGVCWPQELAHPEKAANRIYQIVSGLRKKGWESILLHHADGYLLSAGLTVSWVGG